MLEDLLFKTIDGASPEEKPCLVNYIYIQL